MRYTIVICLVLFVLLIILCAAYPGIFLDIIGKEYEVTANRSVTFDLEDDYDTVRKVFVRTNVSSDLIEYQQGKLIEQHMDRAQLNVQRIRKPQQWNVHANGRFKVRHFDPELGEVVYSLGQKIDITQDDMSVSCDLDEPTKYLKEYRTYLVLYRGGTKSGTGTHVYILVTMKIAWKLPSKSWEDTLQARVNAACDKSIKKLQEGVKSVVDKYRDEAKGSILSLRLK